jgi:hypothetical protein
MHEELTQPCRSGFLSDWMLDQRTQVDWRDLDMIAPSYLRDGPWPQTHYAAARHEHTRWLFMCETIPVKYAQHLVYLETLDLMITDHTLIEY